MRRASLNLTLGAAIFFMSSPAAEAMGFGRTTSSTSMGQRLDFSTRVLLDGNETLAGECVAAEVFVGDTRLADAQVRVTVETAGIDRIVYVGSSVVVDEPVVTVELTLGCQSRMTRRFVAFADPLPVRLADAELNDAAAVRPQRAASGRSRAPTDVAATSRAAASVGASPAARTAGDGAASRQRPVRRAMAPVSRSVAAAAVDVQPRADKAPRQPRQTRLAAAPASAAAPGAPRLRLEAPPLRAAAPADKSPTATAPGPMPAMALAAAAAATETVAEPTAEAASAAQAERAQMLKLESDLARLRGDSQASQRTLGELRSRLREAESERYANGLVYALVAGLLLLFLVIAGLWALRPRQRRGARWFEAGKQPGRAKREPGGSRPEAAPAMPSASAFIQPSEPFEGSGSNYMPMTAPATIGGLDVTTVLGPELIRPAYPPAEQAGSSTAPGPGQRSPAHSVEELIDLEQQVEFFLVLGQDEAAVDLLSAHLRNVGSHSPLPYLQLLEIHQRRADQPAHERVRDAFEHSFGTVAPDWRAELNQGRALDDYPQLVARLQALWATPMHAMRTLDGLLFRRSDADEAFDLPAYRELLFLYSVARELAGNVETDFGSIDLFLPIGEAPSETIQQFGNSAFSVDLDVSGFPDAAADGEELVIRRSVDRRKAG